VIPVLLAGLLIRAESPDQTPDKVFEQRMRDSVAAAQALQGPLDGRWAVTDTRGHRLYVLQIADPAQAAAPLTAAWSDPRTGALGGVDAISRVGGHLSLVFAPGPDGGPIRLTLHRKNRDVWAGWASLGRARRSVRLDRL
jgi:hypothetical protein